MCNAKPGRNWWARLMGLGLIFLVLWSWVENGPRPFDRQLKREPMSSNQSQEVLKIDDYQKLKHTGTSNLALQLKKCQLSRCFWGEIFEHAKRGTKLLWWGQEKTLVCFYFLSRTFSFVFVNNMIGLFRLLPITNDCSLHIWELNAPGHQGSCPLTLFHFLIQLRNLPNAKNGWDHCIDTIQCT